MAVTATGGTLVAPLAVSVGTGSQSEVRSVPQRVRDLSPSTDHLHCVPKPTSRLAGEYDSFDFYVDRKLHLPRRIVATERKALKILTSSFPDLSASSINRGIDPDTFKPLKEWNKLGKPIVERLPKVKAGTNGG